MIDKTVRVIGWVTIIVGGLAVAAAASRAGLAD
jgi:hypothetical protein